MCGIIGVFNVAKGGLPRFERALPLAVMKHRGPDDEGTFDDKSIFLGVRRLAIIDPQGGHQPVQDERGRFHLVMNREVYDYLDSRQGRRLVPSMNCTEGHRSGGGDARALPTLDLHC